MRKAIQHVAIYLISWETFALVVVLVLRHMRPEWFSKAFALIGTGDLKFGHALLLLPAACIVPTYKMGDEILNPKEPRHKELLSQWPGYAMLRTRVFAALVFVILGSIGWLAGIAAGMLGFIVTGPEVALAGLSIALISCGSVGWGRIRLKDALHGV